MILLRPSAIAAADTTVPEIEGLFPDFEHKNSVHETLQQLRKQIPALLTTALTKEAAQTTYTTDTRLTVATTDSDDDDIELASSCDEFCGISSALVLATAAQANLNLFVIWPPLKHEPVEKASGGTAAEWNLIGCHTCK